MKNNKLLIIIALIMLLTIITFATYAYFATGLLNVSNVANLNAITERNNMVFDTVGGEMSLNVTAANMAESLSGNVAAENDTTLTVNFTANTDYRMKCTYDIVYEWTSIDRYIAHSQGETEIEFGIYAELRPYDGVGSGINYAEDGVDLSELVGNQNSVIVVSGATITGEGSNTTTAEWDIESWFVNTSSDQSALSGKNYAGGFKVTNVSCAALPKPTSYWYAMSGYNYNTNQTEPIYTHPNYGGTLQSSGASTNHNVYIGQDSSKYYVCATIQNHEVCFSQPYTQYGLRDHALNTNLTSEQLTNTEQAILQTFIDAGISRNIINCTSLIEASASCSVGSIGCGTGRDGSIDCMDNSESTYCSIDHLGGAYCV